MWKIDIFSPEELQQDEYLNIQGKTGAEPRFTCEEEIEIRIEELEAVLERAADEIAMLQYQGNTLIGRQSWSEVPDVD